MPFTYGPDALHDFTRASSLEWLETNGLGGWASGTVSGANTRRYHGLLVAGSRERSGRMVLVSKLEETIVVDGARFELGASQFPDVVSPLGFEWLQSFTKDLFPQFAYAAGGIVLRKTICTPHGENTTIIRYELMEGPAIELRLRPFLSGRDYHTLLHRNDGFVSPAVHIRIDGAAFEPQPDWYYNFEYAVERERGLDYLEDLYTPGEYVVTLEPGGVLAVVLSTEPFARDPLAVMETERNRREALTTSSDDELIRVLSLAADQFIIEREHDLRTIIAGYHWFTDWGRDTMIALSGLCLATGRFDDARNILRRFIAAASKGMIPNRFPEGSDVPAYNSVDAGLWFFVAVWRYWQASNDAAFVQEEALPVLRDMILWLDGGTRFSIHADVDGLLYAGAGGVQLTWMDAKVGDWIVTPRRGKPVEVNALWYNALRILAALDGDAALVVRAERIRTTFLETFWNEHCGCLYDVVDSGMRDASIRPNQLFALSLPFTLLEGEQAERVLRVCEEQLLTPVGLRTLAPSDPRYRGHMTGPPDERDAAYHQGTVWPWLLGSYVDAVIRVRGTLDPSTLLAGLRAHLAEAGIGTISEVFDGDAPHTPRGCIAQAWSVGEMLRVCAR